MDGCSAKLINASRKTIVEMLEDRGFVVNEKNKIIDDITYPIEAKKDSVVMKVVYLLQKRQVPSLKEYISENCATSNQKLADKECILRHIAVTQYGVNKTFVTLCDQYNIETFKIRSLGVNITKHTLVPHHTLMTKKEDIANLKKALGIQNLETLPIMSKSDPIAKYYGAKVGDLFKVVRYSKTAGCYTSFRYINK